VNRQTLQISPNPIAMSARRFKQDTHTWPGVSDPGKDQDQPKNQVLLEGGSSSMLKQQEANISASFYLIHNIITRGLQVSIESVQGVQQLGFQDESRREGLFKYIRALISVLNSHHLTEDEIAFPYFHDKMPEAPFDLLTRWHQEMVGMLDEIKLAQEKCEQNDQLETNLDDLKNGLTRLYGSWLPHIQMETDEFISKADALIPVEEQLRLIKLFSEHGQKNAVPPELTVPFLLYNLSPEDRSAFSKDMPAEILQHLVPIVWKTHWEPMTPYLLT
jgi:hemerythrin-like domain-containing protein